MAILDFIKNQINSKVYFDGTFGIEIETESKKHYDIPNFSFWDSKGDGSLRDVGMEYILKVPLKYGKELDDALEEFNVKLKDVKFVQDSNSTSVHVHINMLPESWKTLANFLVIYCLVENVLIEVSGETRRNNLFCLPLRSVPFVVDLIQKILTMVQEKNYAISKILGKDAKDGKWDEIKYAALNLGALTRFGSIELRPFRGVTDIEVIKAWVTLLYQMLEYARKDYTPNQIMDQFKEKGILFFDDIFGKDWHLYEGELEKLIEPGPWFAGTIAYMFDEAVWNSLDVLPEKKVPRAPKKRSILKLNRIALDIFGDRYIDLNEDQIDVVEAVYDQEEAMKKAKLNLAPEPIPFEINNAEGGVL